MQYYTNEKHNSSNVNGSEFLKMKQNKSKDKSLLFLEISEVEIFVRSLDVAKVIKKRKNKTNCFICASPKRK